MATKADRQIEGTVRLGGKAYRKGDEAALAKAAKEQGVEIHERVFGVSSTEPRTRNGAAKLSGPESRAKLQAERAGAKGEEGDGDQVDLATTTIADLPAALAEMTDVDAIRKALRKEKRTTAKAHYQTRIEEIKAEEEEAEGSDDEGAE